MDAFKFLLPAVQKIYDKLERAAVANDIAGYLGVDPGLVLDQFKKAATERRGALPDAARSRPRVEIPAIERILVQALVSSDETRREILPRLPQPMTAHFASHEIFEALAQMAPAPLSFTALDARLGEPARALLHEILTADEIGDDTTCLAHAEACLRRLGEDFRRRQMDEIRSRVKSAEREGNIEEVVRWTGELMRLDGG
jgi:DNA primase